MADSYSSSSPSSEGDDTSLAHQINAAIASSHTKINRLILDRMPKAVPPQTENPSAYITGLLHIGAVYIAFESLWQNLLGVHSEIAPIPYSFPFSTDPGQRDATPQITERLRRVLEEAYWPTLLRAARVKADVQAMTGWPDHVYDEQLHSAGTSGRLGKFTLHIRDAVNAKPHLLLAYAYCLYLALLSGGSYIRTELMYLRADFWKALPTPIRPNMVGCRQDRATLRRRHSPARAARRPSRPAKDDASVALPLAFLDFEPPLGASPRQQAKALAAAFKRRFAAAAQLLAGPERTDIVREAAALFHQLEGVVAQLDKMFSAPAAAAAAAPPPRSTYAQRALGPASRPAAVGVRLRDSIAIAKARLLRTRRKASGGSVTATVPIPADELSVTESPHSSRPSSASGAPREDEDWAASTEHGPQHARPGPGEQEPAPANPAALLARDAAVPAERFRTIRYDAAAAAPATPATPASPPPSACHAEKQRGQDANAPHRFDGARSDVEFCPIGRGSPTATAAVQTRAEPNYALYVVVSNFILLVGMAGVMVAYLYVRHGDGRAGAVAAL